VNAGSDLTELTADELATGLAAGDFSCRELLQATLRRIDRINPHCNAIVSLRDGDMLLREADARDTELRAGKRRGWMHGLPQAIKDVAATAGLRTTLGSPLFRDHVPAEDNLMVRRMKDAGCIVIGKTNTPEFGLGSHTFNEVFGTTLNAYDPRKSAGGSSGGAAVALATRMLSVADGSDFMGSLRNPAGWNNVFGFRPSQGRVPSWPADDVYVTQLSTAGPMARTVLDLAHLLDVQAGPDDRVPLSIATVEQFAGAVSRAGAQQARGVRIGWLRDLEGYLATEPGVLDTCEIALERFKDLGAIVEPVALGFAPERVWESWLVWRRWLVAARIATLMRRPENRASIKPEALWEYDHAQRLSGPDVLNASIERTAFYQHMLTLLQRCDCLALPSAQVWPFDAGLRWPAAIAGRAMDTYHRWMEVTIYATFAGLPCISAPAGFSAEGLPMGLQLIGRPRADAAVLTLAAAYEQAAASVLAIRPKLAS
jgi:amidase